MLLKSALKLFCYILIALLIVATITIKMMKVSEELPAFESGKLDTIDPSIFTRTIPKYLCSSKRAFLIIVFSLPQNRFNRDIIRASWKPEAVEMYFLIGKSHSEEEMMLLDNESNQHEDIIIVDIIDSKANSSLKSIIMLDLFIECAQHLYLLKVEDTSFVNPLNVEIEIQKKHSNEENILIGNFDCYRFISNDETSKFFIPSDVYSYEAYVFASGGAYLLNRNAILLLHQVAFQTPIVVPDDGFLTGICASEGNVELQHNEFFNVKKFFERNSMLNRALVIFDLAPDEALDYFKIFNPSTPLQNNSKYFKFSSFSWFYDTLFRWYIDDFCYIP